MLTPLFNTLFICITSFAGAGAVAPRPCNDDDKARPAAARFAVLAREAAKAFSWSERAALKRRLHEMDDRMLADVGLRRDQIAQAVGGGSSFVRILAAFSASVVRRAFSRFAEWRARGRLRRELMELDDRMLADIGLRREEIPVVLAERLRLAIGNPTHPWERPAHGTPAPAAGNDPAPRLAA